MFGRDKKLGICPLCERRCQLSLHHLIPRKLHRRTYYRKHFSREQLNEGVLICRQCHNGIHRVYDEMTLAKQFASLDALRADPGLQRHFAWVARQKIRI